MNSLLVPIFKNVRESNVICPTDITFDQKSMTKGIITKYIRCYLHQNQTMKYEFIIRAYF